MVTSDQSRTFLEKGEKMEKNLLTITQLADACGVSRMTLRRLCDKGILGTANDAEPGEIKLYNYKDVIRLERILSLQRCGVTQKEMMKFFNTREDHSVLYEQIESRYLALQGLMAELRLYMQTEQGEVSVNEEIMPETAFYVKKRTIKTSYDNVIEFLADTLIEAIHDGYRLKLVPSLSLIRDFDDGVLKEHYGEDRAYTACIPVIPGDIEDENILILPERKVISLMWYGKLEKGRPYMKLIREEMEKRGYEPAGPVMSSFVCDASLEYDLSADQAFVKFIMPVQEKR